MRKFFFTAVCLAGLCSAASASEPTPAEGGVMFTVDARARIEPMDIDNLANYIKVGYANGTIPDTKVETIIHVAEEMFPDYDWEGSDLIFQVMMKL